MRVQEKKEGGKSFVVGGGLDFLMEGGIRQSLD